MSYDLVGGWGGGGPVFRIPGICVVVFPCMPHARNWRFLQVRQYEDSHVIISFRKCIAITSCYPLFVL